MKRGIFIVGTDTDIGKTFVSSIIVKGLKSKGIDVGYFKGVLSGAREVNGILVPGDAEEVCKISGIDEEYENMVSYSLRHPYSPHLAARIESVDIDVEKIKSDYEKVRSKYEFVIVEGSGGVICPIKVHDDEVILLEDIIKLLGLTTIVVATAELGTINHTTLTVRYLQSIGIEVRAIILNKFNPQSIIHRDNKDVIRLLTGIDNIFEVPIVDRETLDVDNFLNYDLLIDLMK